MLSLNLTRWSDYIIYNGAMNTLKPYAYPYPYPYPNPNPNPDPNQAR